MLNKLSAFGLILLLLGVICLAVGAYNLSNVNVVQYARFESVWSGATKLTHGNVYGIDIQGCEDWGTIFTAKGGVTEPQPVNITVTSPQGDTTLLKAYFYGIKPDSPYLAVSPVIVDVKYENADRNGLGIDYSTSHIRFMAKQDGNYNVTVQQKGMWSTLPPDYIAFLEEITPNRSTYSLLAMGGGLLCAVGGIASIVGLFRNRNGRHKNKK